VTALTANLLLAVLWAALTGNFTAANLIAGFVIGYVVLAYGLRELPAFKRYRAKGGVAFSFLRLFLWDLLMSNLRVAHDVLTPTHHMSPGVIGVELDARTDAEITALANFITLTPGTLSLDVSSDRKVLYVHVMYLDDEEQVRAGIKALERRLLELMR
jgi:multicomponent Na+:H+ antiporter subunit E